MPTLPSLGAANPLFGRHHHHLHPVFQRRAVKNLSLWQHHALRNVHGLQLCLLRCPSPEILLDMNLTPFLMMMMSGSLRPTRRLFPFAQKILDRKQTPHLQHHLNTLRKTILLQLRLSLKMILPLLFLALDTPFAVGQKLMTRNSSALNRTAEPDTLGRPSDNAFIVILTVAKPAGTG